MLVASSDSHDGVSNGYKADEHDSDALKALVRTDSEKTKSDESQDDTHKSDDRIRTLQTVVEEDDDQGHKVPASLSNSATTPVGRDTRELEESSTLAESQKFERSTARIESNSNDVLHSEDVDQIIGSVADELLLTSATRVTSSSQSSLPQIPVTQGSASQNVNAQATTTPVAAAQKQDDLTDTESNHTEDDVPAGNVPTPSAVALQTPPITNGPQNVESTQLDGTVSPDGSTTPDSSTPDALTGSSAQFAIGDVSIANPKAVQDTNFSAEQSDSADAVAEISNPEPGETNAWAPLAAALPLPAFGIHYGAAFALLNRGIRLPFEPGAEFQIDPRIATQVAGVQTTNIAVVGVVALAGAAFTAANADTSPAIQGIVRRIRRSIRPATT